jgi:hypothetical protein
MSGIPGFNWPAFDAAAQTLRAMAFDVVNPADYDRALGIDPARPEILSETEYRALLAHDLAEITQCDCIAMLPGWQTSRGARVEHTLAVALGLDVLDPATGLPLEESTLQEAQRIVYGDRQGDYGHPLDDMGRTASIWSAILGAQVTAEQVALCMIGVKISRECNRPKRDNRTDIAGYAECLQRIADERARREATH